MQFTQKTGQNKIYVGNIYSAATDNQVKELLECIGPIVSWLPRRQEVKFSAIAEYPDPQTANVAVQKLNGLNFQNRVLKVKLYGPPTSYIAGLPDQIIPTLEQMESGMTIEEFFSQLNPEKKLTVLYELKMIFCQQNQQQKLFQLLVKKPQFTKVLLQSLQELHLLQPPRQLEQYQGSHDQMRYPNQQQSSFMPQQQYYDNQQK